MSTELPDSSPAFSTNTVSEREDPTKANRNDVYTVSEWQTAYSTVKDLTVTKQTKHEDTDQDTTESGSNTDRTYISSTLSRAGERTLLSTTSNSTFSYVEDISSSSSETAPHAVTVQVGKTGVTQHMEFTDNSLFTESGHSKATSENFPTNATQKEVFETEVSHGSQVTQSHTGQPTVTGSDFESMPRTSNPSSTPPLTIINSSDNETDTTTDYFTNQSFSANGSSPSSFITPFILPDSTPTNVSHQYGETTETPTDPVSTSTGEKQHEPQTFTEKTTIPGQTTVPSTLLDMTTSEDESQSTQQTFVSPTNSPSEPTEVLSTAAGPSTHKTPFTTSTLATPATTAPLTTHRFQASTTAKAHSTHSTISPTETTQKTTPTTEEHHPTTATATPSQYASSSQAGAGATDLSTLHIETSTATPSSTKAHSQHTTASYNKSTPIMSTAVITTGKHTETEAITTQMPVKLSLTPGMFFQAIRACIV